MISRLTYVQDLDGRTSGVCGFGCVRELDLDTAEHFANAARPVHAEGVPTLVVDLSALDFIDSTGLREFVVRRLSLWPGSASSA